MDEQSEKDAVCPRRYRLVKRQEALDLNRERILDSARELLLDPAASAFSIEAVARRAGVSRQTVHNQFGSKGALLHFLLERSARGSAVADLPLVFQNPDPLGGLLDLVRTFARFWAGGAELARRLRGFAALDSELGEALRSLEERRLWGIRHLVNRIREAHGRPDEATAAEAIPALFMLSGFDCYDTLRRYGVAEDEIPALLTRLAQAALRLDRECGPAEPARMDAET